MTRKSGVPVAGKSDIFPPAEFTIRKGLEDMGPITGADSVIVTLPGPEKKRIEIKWRRTTGDLAVVALSGTLFLEPIASNVAYVGIKE